MHFLLTGPRGEGRKVMGERDLLLAQPRLVGRMKGREKKTSWELASASKGKNIASQAL